MKTKTLTLSIANALDGVAISDEMPAGTLMAFYDRARKLVPPEEWGSAKVHGASHLSLTYEHSLSSEEETRSLLQDANTRASQVRLLLPPHPGEGLSAEQVDQIRQLLG